MSVTKGGRDIVGGLGRNLEKSSSYEFGVADILVKKALILNSLDLRPHSGNSTQTDPPLFLLCPSRRYKCKLWNSSSGSPELLPAAGSSVAPLQSLPVTHRRPRATGFVTCSFCRGARLTWVSSGNPAALYGEKSQAIWASAWAIALTLTHELTFSQSPSKGRRQFDLLWGHVSPRCEMKNSPHVEEHSF